MGRIIDGRDADQRRLARREAILDSALDLCARHGYLGTSVEAICAHGKVSTKSFYEVFETREACYIGLMQRTTERIKGALDEALATVGLADGDRATRTLIETFAATLDEDPRLAIVLFGRGSATSEAVEQERRATRRWTAQFISEVLLGISPESDGDLVPAIGLTGGLLEIVADWAFGVDLDRRGEVAPLARDLLSFTSVVRRGLSRT